MVDLSQGNRPKTLDFHWFSTVLDRKEGHEAALSSPQVYSSEIMKEIQKEENAGALFVLPSQLNGAEYTSHEKRSIVRQVMDRLVGLESSFA